MWNYLTSLFSGSTSSSALSTSLKPEEDATWDTLDARMGRYSLNTTYYNNKAYKNIKKLIAAHLNRPRRLYRNTRGVYNPVSRLVQLYVAKLYGGELDYDNLEEGAIPIRQADDKLRDAIRQLWIWSNWATKKSLYGRLGTKLGDVALKVVDEPLKGRVRLEVVHPGKIKYAEVDAYGDVQMIVFEYPDWEQVGDPVKNIQYRQYLYTEVITPDEFQTFKNGKPHGYYADDSGIAQPRWDNEYGFVPVSLNQHIDEGKQWGATPFHTAIDKIDELNEEASLLNDQIFKAITPVWAFPGVAATQKVSIKPESTKSGESDKDQLPVLYLPEGAGQPYPMIGQINIADTIGNITGLLREIERDMPELSLHMLREGGNLTAPGVRAGYSDASDRILEARGNYDSALVKAQKMAIAIGGMRGYRNMEPYDLSALEFDDDIQHYIGNRPVIPDTLSRREEFEVLRDADAPTWLVLTKLGESQEVIDRVVGEEETKKRNEVRGAFQGIFGGDDSAEDDDPTGDEIEGEDDEETIPAQSATT